MSNKPFSESWKKCEQCGETFYAPNIIKICDVCVKFFADIYDIKTEKTEKKDVKMDKKEN